MTKHLARLSVILTLGFGIFLHGLRLINPDAFEQVFSPQLDALFTIPIIIGIFAVYRTRRYFRFRNIVERGLVIFTMGYFIVSMPLHLQTWFTGNVDYITAFPRWYSLFFIAYSSVLIAVWSNLWIEEPIT